MRRSAAILITRRATVGQSQPETSAATDAAPAKPSDIHPRHLDLVVNAVMGATYSRTATDWWSTICALHSRSRGLCMAAVRHHRHTDLRPRPWRLREVAADDARSNAPQLAPEPAKLRWSPLRGEASTRHREGAPPGRPPADHGSRCAPRICWAHTGNAFTASRGSRGRSCRLRPCLAATAAGEPSALVSTSVLRSARSGDAFDDQARVVGDLVDVDGNTAVVHPRRIRGHLLARSRIGDRQPVAGGRCRSSLRPTCSPAGRARASGHRPLAPAR